MVHGNKRHWEVYRILKSKFPELPYRNLRILASVMVGRELDPNDDANVSTAIKQIETFSK